MNISLAEHKHLNSHGALIFFVGDNKTKGNDRRKNRVPGAHSLGKSLGLKYIQSRSKRKQ